MTMLRTPRLVLRRAVAEDLAAIHRILSDPRAMRYWATPEHESIEESRAWLQAMLHPGPLCDDFLITLDGAVIGKAGAWRLPEIGYVLHPDHWGQGLAQEALGAVAAHLFAAHPEVTALEADVDPRNAASLRLLKRLGFVETGRAGRTLKWRDEWCDSIYLALPRRPG